MSNSDFTKFMIARGLKQLLEVKRFYGLNKLKSSPVFMPMVCQALYWIGSKMVWSKSQMKRLPFGRFVIGRNFPPDYFPAG